MKILYGTGNPAKLEAMRKRLLMIGIDVIGLKDMNMPLPDIEEVGMTPLENATIKAMAYYRLFNCPVFSCDSGLYISNIPKDMQPGVHVRTVHGRYLTDEEMQEYYIGLARKYGDLRARYRNAICYVQDRHHIYSAMDEDMASEEFIITTVPHPAYHKGFPLDRLSIHIPTGRYYYDLSAEELNKMAVEDGFLRFFKECMEKNISG